MFFRGTGLPTAVRKTNPWFRGQILGGKCAQEPTPGSAVKHCRFLDTGGGVVADLQKFALCAH